MDVAMIHGLRKHPSLTHLFSMLISCFTRKGSLMSMREIIVRLMLELLMITEKGTWFTFFTVSIMTHSCTQWASDIN